MEIFLACGIAGGVGRSPLARRRQLLPGCLPAI